MAFQKTLSLPNGASGDYITIGPYLLDPMTRTLSAHFHLYFSAALRASNPSDPLRPIVAKLRLSGAVFDSYLSTAALAEVESDDPVRSQIYAAAKVQPVESDFGPAVFADAVDV